MSPARLLPPPWKALTVHVRDSPRSKNATRAAAFQRRHDQDGRRRLACGVHRRLPCGVLGLNAVEGAHGTRR